MNDFFSIRRTFFGDYSFPHTVLAPKNDIGTLLSFEIIQATQNQNAAHFNQSCSGKLIKLSF